MTKDDITRMAREAGLRSAVLLHMYGKESALCDSEIEELRQLEHLVELVRAAEREACAKVCEQIVADAKDWDSSYWDAACMNCSAAIQARGNK